MKIKESNEVILTKGNYTLFVGDETEGTGLSYQIVNHLYGVIEAETRILPQAYKFLEDLSAALDASIALEEEDTNKPHDGSVYELKSVE